MSWTLFLLGLSTLAAEDLACIAAGALVAAGQVGFVEASAACLAGIVAGDMGLYAAGRWLGRRALQSRWLRGRISEDRLERASEWIARRGGLVVLASRFTPGMRLPVYLAAGALRTGAGRFFLYFLAAALVWTPILVGASAWLGRHAAVQTAGAAGVFGAAASMFAALHWAAPRLLSWERRRRLLGRILRVLRWEFWPVWAAYLPVVPWILWLAIRHRSFTLFTLANPGIPGGGLTGESKSAILKALEPSGRVASFRVGEWTGSLPCVVKPDVGERGAGVVIARTRAQAQGAIRKDSIVQQYVPGVEFGIFYARRPRDARGRVLSLTAKVFPSVEGDGRRTLEELILADSRAVCLARVYLERHAAKAGVVPAAGERVPLVDIGSHCRGAAFENAAHLITPELEAEVDRVSGFHPEFYFGRYDVRATSEDALRRGEFTILELNGVAGEPAHIYDPAVSLLDAYRALYRHWSLAFAIGAENRKRGFRPTSLRELRRLAG